MEINISEEIQLYFTKANNKIAEISTEAADLLEKTSCRCDITEFIDKILDINSSMFNLDKGWDDIDTVFGYKPYLLGLENVITENKILSIIDKYTIRYDMNDASIIYYPLYSLHIGGIISSPEGDDRSYTKAESNARFYPLNSNPAGYLTEFTETDPTVPSHVKSITVQEKSNWSEAFSWGNHAIQGYITSVDIDGFATEAWVSLGFYPLNSNPAGYLTSFTETDPTVPAHVKSITPSEKSNWSTAFSWGNHATQGYLTNLALDGYATENWVLSKNYLTSFTETDPTVPPHVKSITPGEKLNWNTAFGWGNHATQGYLKIVDLNGYATETWVNNGFYDKTESDLRFYPLSSNPSGYLILSDLAPYQLLSQKGEANGYTPLDANGKVPLIHISDILLGQVRYIGTWNASTNIPTLPDPTTVKGNYYVATNSGTQFGKDYNTGDWVISDGVIWDKVDNTDAVATVFGRIGNILAVESDYQDFYPRLSQSYVNPTWISSLAWSKITGTPTTLSGYGITDAVPSGRTITINGVTQDLSVNRTFNVGTLTSVNLGYTAAALNGTVTNTAGNNATIPAATTFLAGLLTSADKSKLDGIAVNANNYSHPTQSAIDSGLLTGAVVISQIQANTLGHITSVNTRTLTLANLGYTGATNADNYASWNLRTNGVQRTTVVSGGVLDIVGGTNVSVAYGAGGVVTLSSTDTNTTYTAGTGLALTGTVFSNAAPDQIVSLTGNGATSISGTYPNFTISSVNTNTTYTAGSGLTLTGTVFSLPVTISGTGSYVQSVVQSTGGLTVTLGTPPDTIYTHPTQTALDSGTLTGAVVISRVAANTLGHVTDIATRTLTLANLGYTGATNANNYVHPTYTTRNITLSGGTVLASFTSDAIGSVTGITTRTLTPGDIGAQVAGNYVTLDTTQTITGVKTFTSTISGDISGNSGTATTLETARTINGTSFNGSTNIITANWGTARTITIGDQSKSVNGSINVSWSQAEIGAVPWRRGLAIDVNAFNDTGIYQGPTSVFTNRGPSVTNAGALFNINTHPGNYFSQLWFDTSGNRFYHRVGNNTLPTGEWDRVMTLTLTNSLYSLRTTNITAGTGLSGGGNLSANLIFNVTYGTTAGTSAQGNDSRINNGQTAFGWGDFRDFGLGPNTRNNSINSVQDHPTGFYYRTGGTLFPSNRSYLVVRGVRSFAITARLGNMQFVTGMGDGATDDVVREVWHNGNITPVPTSRSITAGTGLSGGGNLSIDRTINAVVSSSGFCLMPSNGRQAAGANMNTWLDSGVYGINNSVTNGPSTSSFDPVLVIRNNDVGGQLKIPRNNGSIEYRGWSNSGSSFTAWKTLWDSQNFNPAAYSPLTHDHIFSQIRGYSGDSSYQGTLLLANLIDSGNKLYPDEEFALGNNGVNIYNHLGNGTVTITRLTGQAAIPNSTGAILRIVNNGGTSNPGKGGFTFATLTRAGAIFLVKFKAKIPVGEQLVFASNSTGTNTLSRFITPSIGTGKWEDYSHLIQSGDSGSFSSTNFFSLSGSGAVTWDLASATVVDLTDRTNRNYATVNTTRLNVNSTGIWGSYGSSNSASSYHLYYRGGTLIPVGYIGTDGGGIVGGGSGSGFGIRSDADLILAAGSGERMRIDSSGNVAIGNSTPILADTGRGNVTINGTNTSILTLGIGGVYSAYLFATSDKVELSSNTQPITFVANGAERMRIASNGNVGFNRNNPNNLIHLEQVNTPTIQFTRQGIVNWYVGNPTNVATNNFSIGTDAGSNFNILNFDTSGNVGINRTSMSSKLHIGGTSGGGTSFSAIKISNEAFGGGSIDFTNLTSGDLGGIRMITQDVNTGNFDDGILTFRTAFDGVSSERMRIDSFGNVAIGNTSNSGHRLQVNGNVRVEGVGNAMLFDTLNVTASNSISVINNFETLIFTGRGSGGFCVVGDSNIRLGFGLPASATQTSLFVLPSGNVTIGTTGLAGGGTLQVAGTTNIQTLAGNGKNILLTADSFLRINQNNEFSSGTWFGGTLIRADGFYAGSTGGTTNSRIAIIGGTNNGLNAITLSGVNGNITAIGDIIAFSTSDIRLKNNLTIIPDSLDKISKLGGYSFEWNNLQTTYKGKDYGIIAQEVEKLFPEMVTTRETGYKAVKYDRLIPVMIEGIKELTKRDREKDLMIQELNDQLKELKFNK